MGLNPTGSPILSKDRIVSYMHTLGLDMHDAEHFFDLVANSTTDKEPTALTGVSPNLMNGGGLCSVFQSATPKKSRQLGKSYQICCFGMVNLFMLARAM